jgi:hypothetical protein
VVSSVSKNRLRPSGVFKSSAAGQFGSRRGGFRGVGFAAQALWMATLATQAPRVKLPAEFNADYSFYEKFSVKDTDGERETSLKLLLRNIDFCSNVQPGLEFVDVLSNAVRRALTNKLQKEGWQNIRRLMIHENDKQYIHFVLFQEGGEGLPR